ncbi:TadE/TadG family type IV pilus assembly protein [Paenibacillus gorillae]|uniref:TadE/TadG family type IV pilus assembly protein n=1 Tax=Paenibacillus gorillae TaxID=1243662 RepID=UPI0004BA11EC|nr:TadE family protein [Paenibacillus gorillae]
MNKRIKFSARVRWLQQLRCEQGSFTLESAIVFPVLLMMVLIFVLFAIYLYQQTIVYYTASVTAERTAYSWDNSSRNTRSGIVEGDAYDGLYWRVAEDQALQSLFGLSAGSDSDEVMLELPTAGEREGMGLAARKLAGGSAWLGEGKLAHFQGAIAYERGLLKREVKVSLKQPVSLAPLERMLGRTEPGAIANASIVDPVEFIRTVDLVRYYTEKFKSAWGGTEKDGAAKTLGKYSGK